MSSPAREECRRPSAPRRRGPLTSAHVFGRAAGRSRSNRSRAGAPEPASVASATLGAGESATAQISTGKGDRIVEVVHRVLVRIAFREPQPLEGVLGTRHRTGHRVGEIAGKGQVGMPAGDVAAFVRETCGKLVLIESSQGACGDDDLWTTYASSGDQDLSPPMMTRSPGPTPGAAFHPATHSSGPSQPESGPHGGDTDDKAWEHACRVPNSVPGEA